MKTLYFFIATLILFAGCRKEKTESYSISGVAQKGPFSQGSKVTVYELNDKLEQTGKVFKTETTDDFGSFSLKDMLLTSSIVQVEVEGRAYNELYGGYSDVVTIGNIVDLDKANVVNVNILSDLARLRMKYLIQNGSRFDKARSQAESEVMKCFGLDSFYVAGSEILDITSGTDAGSALLALSSIIMTSRQEAQMMLQQFIAKIRSDIETDGTLNDNQLISFIKQGMSKVNPVEVVNNLSVLYGKTIPSFKPHLDAAMGRFSLTVISFSDVTFPDLNGNILARSEDTLRLSDTAVVLLIKFPDDGYKKIRVNVVASNIHLLTISEHGTTYEGDGTTVLLGSDNNKVSYEMNYTRSTREIRINASNFGSELFYVEIDGINNFPNNIIKKKWLMLNMN